MASIKQNNDGTISITLPAVLYKVTDAYLQNTTRDVVLENLNKAYNREVEQVEDLVQQARKGKTGTVLDQIQRTLEEAMQQLGQKKNAELDAIYAYYKAASGQSDNNQQGNQIAPSSSTVANRTKELRPTPGYTNYVVSTGKNINGTIASSSVFKRYYSDISAEAYINGEWFEDINTIAWQVQRQQYPLYGYNSYIFDDLALGQRIISGQFTINFTEPDIINKAIKKGVRSNGSVNNASTYEEYAAVALKNQVTIDGGSVTYQSNPVHDAIWKPRFDIDIVFGEKEKLGGVEFMPKHIILWDCNVSSSGIAVSANGGTLVEQYAFLARDFKIIS